VEVEVAPVRLGTSSFDLRYVAAVDGQPVVTITTTYVTVVAGEARSQPIPADLRTRLEQQAAAPTTTAPGPT
jgi:acyl-CoA thioesterase FadM